MGHAEEERSARSVTNREQLDRPSLAGSAHHLQLGNPRKLFDQPDGTLMQFFWSEKLLIVGNRPQNFADVHFASVVSRPQMHQAADWVNEPNPLFSLTSE